MAIARYRTGLTGGTATDLDGIEIASLVNGDLSWVMAGGKAYLYKFDSTATDAESSPSYIRPDDYASAGVWILQQSPYDVLGAMPSGLVMSSFVGGDASHGSDATNDIDFAIFSCMDSTNTVEISTTAVMTKRADAAYDDDTTNGGMMNNGSYPFAAGKLYAWVAMGDGVAGDGQVGFLDVDDIANIAARVTTAGYSYHKVFGYMHTKSASAAWVGFTNNGPYVQYREASESVLSGGVNTTLAVVDHTDFIIESYTELIEYGVRDDAENDDLYASDDGTNVSFAIGRAGVTLSDTDISVWGSKDHISAGLKPYLSTREFRSSANTLDLLMQGVKFKR